MLDLVYSSVHSTKSLYTQVLHIHSIVSWWYVARRPRGTCLKLAARSSERQSEAPVASAHLRHPYFADRRRKSVFWYEEGNIK